MGDVLARLGDVLKDERNAYTRATALAAQGEIMRLSEKARRQHDELQRLTATIASLRAENERIREAVKVGLEALAKIKRIKACVLEYAEMEGLASKPVPSAVHLQSSFIDDAADEAAASMRAAIKE